jgi:hypothetical protein
MIVVLGFLVGGDGFLRGEKIEKKMQEGQHDRF